MAECLHYKCNVLIYSKNIDNCITIPPSGGRAPRPKPTLISSILVIWISAFYISLSHSSSLFAVAPYSLALIARTSLGIRWSMTSDKWNVGRLRHRSLQVPSFLVPGKYLEVVLNVTLMVLFHTLSTCVHCWRLICFAFLWLQACFLLLVQRDSVFGTILRHCGLGSLCHSKHYGGCSLSIVLTYWTR